MDPTEPGTPVGPGRSGRGDLVIVSPPFPAPLPHDERPAAVRHTPAAAREAVLSLHTVSAVRGEEGPSRLDHPGSPATRAELDWVHGAAWGSTLKISDPALVEDGISTCALENEVQAQRERHPGARIVAACERDFGAHYGKIVAVVPGAPDLVVDGFDELDVIGDPRATLAAVGAEPADCGEEQDDGFFDWHGFLHVLTGGALSVYVHEQRRESHFLVSRDERAAAALEDVWFPAET